jgi:apolipoprotein N-acyltransferase
MDSASWRQLAAFGGVYTATFAVALVNLLFFCIARYAAPSRRRLYAAALILFLLIYSLLPIAALRAHVAPAETKPLTIAIVSVQYPQQDIWQASSTIAAQETAFIQDASEHNADLILLPEGAGFFSPFSPRTPAAVLPEGSRSVVVDSGELRVDDGSIRLRSAADAISGQQPIRDKHVLAPDGEYLPSYVTLILDAIGKPHAADTFTALRGFANGTGTGAPLSVGAARMSVIFCAELFDPGLVSQIVHQQHLNLMLGAVSHAPFHQSFTLEQDSRRFMQAQAVQAGVPMAVSALQSPAYIIDRYGRILAQAGSNSAPANIVRTLMLP